MSALWVGDAVLSWEEAEASSLEIAVRVAAEEEDTAEASPERIDEASSTPKNNP